MIKNLQSKFFNGIVKYINQRILYRKGGVGEIVPHVWGVLSERRERRRGACPPSGRKFRAESHSERKRGIFLLVTSYGLLVTGLCGCQAKPLYRDTQLMMGTFVEVISPDKNAAGIVFSEMRNMENLLSKYQPHSEISRLNALGKLELSPEVLYVIKKAKEFWQLSEGAFDITVGPLLDLWGFTDKNYLLPKDDQIKETLKLIGSDKIIFKPDSNVVEFAVLGMKIDLGAIAKGYTIDCAINKLKDAGIKSALVNAGGDVYCLGKKLGWIKAKPWSIAIKNPRQDNVLDYLKLEDMAVATSGDYEQYFIKDNKRYAHIFDPHTGYPAQSAVLSVTVIAQDCLTADALATAIFVLGKEKGEALAKNFANVKVKIINEKDVSAPHLRGEVIN